MSGPRDPNVMEVPCIEVMDAAMQWLLRLRDESVTERDIAAWLKWYESNERNKLAFDQAQDFWQRSGTLAIGSGGKARMRRLYAQGCSMSAAGSHLVPGWLQRSRRGLHRRRRQVRSVATIALALVAMAYMAWAPPIGDPGVSVEAMLAHPVRVDVRRTRLSDGSVVELAARSSVAMRYTGSVRLVELRGGEAYFDVAVDHERPFVVMAEGISVRAVGTAFNVRKAKGEVVVTVAEGTVDVYRAERAKDVGSNDDPRPASGAVRVNAGNEVLWVEGGRQPVVSSVDLQRALSWRQGRLEFVAEPLSSVIGQVARHTTTAVRVGDPAVDELHYTGTVLTTAADEWLRALPSSFPVRLVSEPDGTVVVAIPGE